MVQWRDSASSEERALLPLNRARRLRGDVVDDAVDAFYFIHDAGGNDFQDFVRKRNPIGSHAIFRTHGADRAGIGIRARVAHDADPHNGKQHGEGLPNLRVESGFFNLADDDVVALAQNRYALGRDFSQNSDGKAGTREWLPL